MGKLKRHAWELVDEADAMVESISVPEFESEREQSTVIPLDIRDIREIWIEGSIPDAEHAPRGMLEFWADPDTEYYKEFFELDTRYVVYCNQAGRSALAAKRLNEMGYQDIAHLEGGFTAWKKNGCPVVDIPQKDYKQ